MLEARPQSCFSNRFLLTLDDEPLGSYDLHRFGRRARIRLTSGERMRFERKGWTGFRVHLLDEWTDAVLAEGGPRLFGRTWDLRLSIGPARLQRCGRVCDESGSIASTEVSGPLWRGWRVVFGRGAVPVWAERLAFSLGTLLIVVAAVFVYREFL